MKKYYFIIIIVISIVLMHFVTAGMAGLPNQVVTEGHSVENAELTKGFQNVLKSEDDFEQDRSIFSNTTLISLFGAVIAIVAFRRNTYS
jgi:hypothetical protein